MTGIVNADGSSLQYLDLKVPGQATWQPGPIFPDGQHLVLLSMEPRRDGPGRPFEEYYTQTPTHLWDYDLESGALVELCTKDRMAPFMTPQLLLGADRLLVQVVRDKVGQTFSVRLDGSDPQAVTGPDEGLPYGLSLSPNGQRIAFHLASPAGYQVWTCDLRGKDRLRIAGDSEHLYFGTSWSPDGEWITYVDCDYLRDAGHDWADVCVGRADGTDHRVLTSGHPMWFAAVYGNPERHGGGSNVPAWMHDGSLLFPRRTAQAQVAWEFQAGRPDLDHFNREYKPELARGGTAICRLDPRDGSMVDLTPGQPAEWNFRASQSPDGHYVAWCQAATGGLPAIWVMDSDGKNPHLITRGREERGADHPRWI